MVDKYKTSAQSAEIIANAVSAMLGSVHTMRPAMQEQQPSKPEFPHIPQ